MARGIIFKNNGINELSSSPTGYKYVGYDGEIISEKNGATVSAIGGGSAGVIEGTYDELTILKSNNELIPGAFYEITDFQTIYDQPDYDDIDTTKTTVVTKTAPVDPILLLATSPNTFAKEVWRPSTPQHRLEYNFDWTTTEKMGFPAKGLITKCKDEFNNITGYDHTVVLFKRYESVSGSGVFNSFWDTGFGSDEVLTFDGITFFNTLSKSLDSLISLGFPGFVLPNNVFLGSSDNNTLKSLSNNNTFGNNTSSNTFGNNTSSNTFGDDTKYNTFGDDTKYNTFGNITQSNTFGNDTQYNTFGDGITNNTFSNGTNNIDFTTATHIYQQYYCEIFRRQDLTFRLRYTDNSDALVVVAPTA